MRLIRPARKDNPFGAPRRVMTLILIGPAVAVLMGILIQAGGNEWVMRQDWGAPTEDGRGTVVGHYVSPEERVAHYCLELRHPLPGSEQAAAAALADPWTARLCAEL
jgi:hypothetical protein